MELLRELLEISEEELYEARRAFKRKGGKIVKVFRCTAGKKKGRTVKNVSDCFKKKDIRRSIKARRIAKRTRFVRARKSKITRRKAMSRTVVRLNQRIKHAAR